MLKTMVQLEFDGRAYSFEVLQFLWFSVRYIWLYVLDFFFIFLNKYDLLPTRPSVSQ